MNDHFELAKDQGAGFRGKLEPRHVFISHAHADRDLATSLGVLLNDAFSGVVQGFASSDPGPTGGIMPGDQWFSQIEARLSEAESIWVLATSTSIARPWIYWEAGIGRALCPRGVVVLRVAIAAADVPSPLNKFQIYDGLDVNSVSSLLHKVGAQIGMTLADVLVNECATSWIESAKGHKPLPEEQDVRGIISAERLDRMEYILTRFEGIAASMPSSSFAPNITAGTEAQPRARRDIASVAEMQARISETRRDVVGTPEAIYYSLQDLGRALNGSPSDTTFSVGTLDRDGDVPITATRGGQVAVIWYRPGEGAIESDLTEISRRAGQIVREIADVATAESKASSSSAVSESLSEDESVSSQQ